MSKIDPFVKETFERFSLSSSSPDETLVIAFNLAKNLPSQMHGYRFSIVGRIGHGKTTFVNGIHQLFIQSSTSSTKSKLSGRINPAWEVRTDSSKKLMLRIMDMAAMDQFKDPVIPSLQQQTIDIIEHATYEQQEQSTSVIEIKKDGKSQNRLINVYINKKIITPRQINTLRFRP